MTCYMGIDPGKSGAVVVMDEDGEVNLCKLDGTERDIADFMRTYRRDCEFAFLERVSAMPRQGVSSTFKFGTSYGFLRGCLISMEIPFEEVTPQKWQKAMGCMTHGDKNISKARAQQSFPRMKITHAIADALLIAEHCRRTVIAREGKK